MKIGILSMQKILNYGSFLQAFSLKMQFEQRGHDVYFIDIKPGRQIFAIPQERLPILKKFDRYFFKRIENFLLGHRMDQIHTDDYTRYLDINKQLNSDEQFDLAVIGSDEVFNATVPSRWGFTTQLFGEVSNAKKVVTYAASCGSTTYQSVEKCGITEDIRRSMRNLSYTSVRDKNTYDFVNKITGSPPIINVDPVFLADYDHLIPEIKIRKPYLLVYAYGNRINNEEEIAAIKSYAKKNSLQTISVGMQQRWCSHNIPATAFELLWYFKNADSVVTDTFHGTVFSIKYNKKFVTLIRDSNRNKLGGLLNQFGLKNRLLDQPVRLETVMEQSIDYERVNQTIKTEQEKSAEYLDKICQLR